MVRVFFDIDNCILRLNSIEKRNVLGRERNGNQLGHVHLNMHHFEMTEEAAVTDLIYDMSKQGFLVIHIN
jgi:hypothetical protein